jgi:hypothetical protein
MPISPLNSAGPTTDGPTGTWDSEEEAFIVFIVNYTHVPEQLGNLTFSVQTVMVVLAPTVRAVVPSVGLAADGTFSSRAISAEVAGAAVQIGGVSTKV